MIRKTIIVCIILAAVLPAFTDTLKLSDGSLMTGKIIKEQEGSLVLSNAFGTFRIRKSEILETHVTGSYTEDSALYRDLNLRYSENEIRRHYLAGMEKKESLTARKKTEENAANREKEERKREARKDVEDDPTRWNSTRISFSGFAHLYSPTSNTSGQSYPTRPYGYSGFLAIDRGLDVRPGPRNPGIPGLRFVGGFHYLFQPPLKLQFYTASVGLMWALPSIMARGGCFVFALMPGVAIFDWGKDPLDLSTKSFQFAGQAIAGYQKSWGIFSIFIQARYIYIHDKTAFHSIGGEFGFGFNAL